jgi:ERF superfamily
MRTSERTGELLVALLKARAQFQPIVKSAHVTVTTKAGRKYDFDYAPLEVLQAATETALGAEGLVLVSAVQPRADGTVEVVTRLLHTSEQWLESGIPSGPLEDVKALSGFISYARRYNTLALLDLSAEDDLDGSQATGDHIEPRTKAASAPVATNGHTPPPAPDESLAHPTESHLAALKNLACTECGDPLEVYEDRLRTTMKIPKQASVAPKLLTRTMSMAQYMDVFAYYRRLEAQLVKGKEATGGTAPTTQQIPQPAPAPTVEGPPASPSPAVSSFSAPVPSPDDAAERDRVRLRAEVAQWDLRVPPEEIEHVIQHNVYSKARALLWKCRRQDTAAD